MRKSLLAFTLLIALASCSKQSTVEKQPLTSEIREQKITAALGTSNPNRLVIAERILLAAPTPAGYSLKEVIATNKETGFRSFGYIVVKKDGTPSTEMADPYGTYTGWMLFSDGCYYHGTFIWSGDPSNYVFVGDSSPNTDNYIGNEPRCMSDDDFDNFV